MDIALIGYGRMGKVIEKIALSRGHKIGLIIDEDNVADLKSENLANIDVAIEFTIPGQALGNIKKCLQDNVSIVSGTTGWLEDIDDAIACALKSERAFLYASNFSIGVNIMFHLNSHLSELMRGRTEYKPIIEEVHHIRKLDAPSGTAISLAGGIVDKDDNYEGWINIDSPAETGSSDVKGKIPIVSRREGYVPGTHEIVWKSPYDSLSLRHEAFGREGFALGAVLAAEFVIGKSGFFTMRDMLGF